MNAGGVGTAVVLILALIVANGLFAMSEMAIVAARRARLRKRAEEGDAGARRALDLAEHPNRFLSTVQIGITLVGILAGAYGGATIAGLLAARLQSVPALTPYSQEIAFALVVVGIAYLSLVLGELVPKRIALTHPERIAALISRPMHMLSVAATPLVKVLSLSTDTVLRIIGVQKSKEPAVTEHEITALIEQGAVAGVIAVEEQQLLERIFELGDQRVDRLMTPRRKIVWLDLTDSAEHNREKTVLHRHSRFPVCEGGIDHVVGFVDVRDLWANERPDEPLDLRALLRKPLFVPEGMRALRLLQLFRESGVHFALVLDEYGGIQGVATLNDVLEEITGSLVVNREAPMRRREDGSWLVDASLPMDEFWEGLGIDDPRPESHQHYNTVGGFVLNSLGRIPAEGDSFEAFNLRFEIIDMDGYRVDKVLVSPAVPRAEPE